MNFRDSRALNHIVKKECFAGFVEPALIVHAMHGTSDLSRVLNVLVRPFLSRDCAVRYTSFLPSFTIHLRADREPLV